MTTGNLEDQEYRLSVDTGGTFTDGFVSGLGRQAQVKVDTTPHDLTEGFTACVEAAASAMGETVDGFLSRTSVVHFSSTIATNTAVQRSGPKVGLIISAGTLSAYGTAEQFDSLSSFVDQDLVLEVAERVNDSGQVESGPDPAALDEAVRQLLERGIAMLVISFRNAHLNPANEERARALITASYPRHYLGAIPVLQASRISLDADDFGRTAAAVLNAYLHPVLVRSLYKAEDRLRQSGYQRPLLIVNTDGSSTRVAKTRALDTYNSGPSAGVLGAAIVAEALGAKQVCTFDVGGTTTDVAHIRLGVPPRTPATLAGSLSVPHPSVDLWSFGLGGGSIIAREGTRLTVGPGSSGSSPGPACFGLGGSDATPTDVWLMLGYIDADNFLGGRRVLRRERSEEAIERLFGADDHRSTQEKALESLDAIHAAVATGMRAWAANSPELTSGPDRWLLSYGGGGGLLCVAAAESLGIDQVVVFPQSSVFSAFGGGLLPIAHNYQSAVAGNSVPATIEKLVMSAERDLRAEGVVDSSTVRAVLRAGAAGGEAEIVKSCSLAELLSGGSTPAGIITAQRIELWVEVERPQELAVRMSATATTEQSARAVITKDGPASYPIRSGLGQPGATPIVGPAFLAARDTTILVPEGWYCSFTDLGYGLIRKGSPS
ncbi:MAG TPA: hydantoinase/oxoprolinase family protein [Terrimesophilobacter sp.]|nr:hydantoinase/oxoprolinase family protein [Terrimesophilobacter sp.]